MVRNFVDKLMDGIVDKESLLCVGLDPQVKYIPEIILQRGCEETKDKRGFEPIGRTFLLFNKEIIDAVEPYAAVVKPQMAFYEAYGSWGVWAFEETVKYAKKQGLLVIEDAKRCDGGDTAQAYADGHLGEVHTISKTGLTKQPSLDLDAMTIVSYIGTSCMTPFIDVVKTHGKGIFVVTKTSFKPNSEFEQIQCINGNKVWQENAKLVGKWGERTEGESRYKNVGVVMGATYPEDAVEMRKILPDVFFLVPGYGAQGGGADGAVVGVNSDGYGAIINSSRGITYAYRKDKFPAKPEDFAISASKSAEFSKDDLNHALERADKLPW